VHIVSQFCFDEQNIKTDPTSSPCLAPITVSHTKFRIENHSPNQAKGFYSKIVFYLLSIFGCAKIGSPSKYISLRKSQGKSILS